jgi:hypothetical protein
MDETYLKGRLVKQMRSAFPDAVIFRHEDYFTAGIPDISMTWLHNTLWIEIKHAKPSIKGKKIQAYTCDKLNGIYVVYREVQGMQFTLLIAAGDVLEDKTKCFEKAFGRAEGYDHQFVIEYLKFKFGVKSSWR